MSILNTPIKVNKLELNNRLVMPPMATAKSGVDGKVTKQLCDYYKEKSEGGHIGLIITEHSYVNQEGKASKGQLSLSEDSDITGLRELISVIHSNNTKAIAQINHVGGAAKHEVTGCEVLSSSAVEMPGANWSGIIPREMDLKDIKKVIDDFANSAVRVKEAGFDGVEIHSAHGYLLSQFLSPLTNKRTDKYGGTLKGRIRLHLEIIEAIRNATGEDFLVALRLGACDYMDGGTTLSDSIFAAKKFEKEGVDLLDISGGFCGYVRPGAKIQGYFSELSDTIRRNVSIPVMLTGGIVNVAEAEKLLQDGKADLIGVGRAILRDSKWAKAALESISNSRNSEF